MKRVISKKAYLPFLSSDTVSFFLPFALRRVITALPPTDDILCLNPCLFVLLRLLGWYVLFMTRTIFGMAKVAEFLFEANLWHKNFLKNMKHPGLKCLIMGFNPFQGIQNQKDKSILSLVLFLKTESYFCGPN